MTKSVDKQEIHNSKVFKWSQPKPKKLSSSQSIWWLRRCDHGSNMYKPQYKIKNEIKKTIIQKSIIIQKSTLIRGGGNLRLKAGS